MRRAACQSEGPRSGHRAKNCLTCGPGLVSYLNEHSLVVRPLQARADSGVRPLLLWNSFRASRRAAQQVRCRRTPGCRSRDKFRSARGRRKNASQARSSQRRAASIAARSPRRPDDGARRRHTPLHGDRGRHAGARQGRQRKRPGGGNCIHHAGQGPRRNLRCQRRPWRSQRVSEFWGHRAQASSGRGQRGRQSFRSYRHGR